MKTQKKLLALFFALCMALATSIPAFADGRGPAFSTYEAVCPKAVTVYQETWSEESDTSSMNKLATLPAGTTVQVDYEYEWKGKLYGSVRYGDKEDYRWGYVLLSDLQLKNDVYPPSKGEVLPRSYSVRVTEKDGIAMRKGPNEKFPVVTTIPRNIRLTFSVANDMDEFYWTWAYVTFGKYSGWIYVMSTDTENGVVQIPNDRDRAQLWAMKDVPIYDGYSDGNLRELLDEERISYLDISADSVADKQVGTLQKDKKLSYKYYHNCETGTWYYVTVGLRSGWVYADNWASDVAVMASAYEAEEFMAYRPFTLKLFAEPSERSQSTAAKVAASEPFGSSYITHAEAPDDAEYGSSEWYYTELDGKSGWYNFSQVWDYASSKIKDDNMRTQETYTQYVGRENGTPIWSSIEREGKPLGTIPAGKSPEFLYVDSYRIENQDEEPYVTVYYVHYNGISGWVFEEDLHNLNSADEPEEETTEPEETTEEWEEETYEVEDTWDETDDEIEEAEYVYEPVPEPTSSGLSPTQLVLVCVGGAVVLALASAVTLVLIRRKKQRRAEAAAPQDTAQAEQTNDTTDTTDNP